MKPLSPRASLVAFSLAACGVTWALAAPSVLAASRQEAPAPAALALAGLSAFGPTIAALLVARGRDERRDIFARPLGSPGVALLCLLLPMALHQLANGLETALGGHPSRWVYLPQGPEQIAALVVFSLGEEPGWRGYAYKRAASLVGPLRAALLVGALWGWWHLLYFFSMTDGHFRPGDFAQNMVELPLWSLVIAWAFERSGRSLLVALALHAGGHLDNVHRAPPGEVRLQALHLALLALAAALAARSLARQRAI